MREALARADHDFVLSEPEGRPRSRRRVRRLGGLSRILRVAHRIIDYPNRVAGALLASLVFAIIVNALVLQKTHHPAPLFGKSIAPTGSASPARMTPAQGAAPTPPMTAPTNSAAAIAPLLSPDPIDQLLQSGGETTPSGSGPGKSAETARHRESKDERTSEMPPARNDPISALLASQSPVQASKTVAAAQRALIKLGFVLKADGRMGNATRQAIEQFEHDRGLPVRGELSPRVLRQLSAAAGVPVD